MTVSPMPLDLLGGIATGTDRESSEASNAFSRLRASFDQASRDYEAGRYEEAGERFLEAAREARGEAGSYTRSALALSRSAAYRNAARAWSMAGSLDKERGRMELAGQEDVDCQKEIARILELLDPRA
jgi:Tfp pilus assembly protein PilF